MKYTSHIKPIQTFPERIPTDSKWIQTNSNRFKRIQTHSNAFKQIQTDSNELKIIQKLTYTYNKANARKGKQGFRDLTMWTPTTDCYLSKSLFQFY